MVFFSLTIESPESIAGDYEVVPAQFGAVHIEGVKRMQVVDVGNQKTLSRQQMHKKLALVPASKVYNEYDLCFTQQTALAHGVLIIKDTREPPHAMELPMGLKDKITIPYAAPGIILSAAIRCIAGVFAYLEQMARHYPELWETTQWRRH